MAARAGFFAGRLRSVWLPSLTIALALGLSWHFVVRPLRPWPDQGWLLQAAMRHADGKGLTWLPAPVEDLTEVAPQPMVYFPPFYPLAVSGLLQIGVPWESAVKGINVFALALGVVGWVGLASRWLHRFGYRILFASLLVVAGGATIPKGGTADYLVWAATPYWIRLILAARQAEEAKLVGWYGAIASALVGLLIGVRWAAVVLIPAGSVALLLPNTRRESLVGRCLSATLYALPALSVYFLIVAINRYHSDSGGTLLSFITPNWQLHRVLTLYPFESVFTIPLAVEPMLKRIWRAIDPGTTSSILGVFFRAGVPTLLLAGLVWARHRRGEGDAPGSRREFRLVVGITIVATVLFLAFMTARYNWTFVDWSYLDEARYYRPIWPAAALLWLTMMEDSFPIRLFRTVAVAILAVGFVYLLQAQVRFEHRMLTVPDESWELVEKVTGLRHRNGLQVVFDNDVSDYVVRSGPNLLAFPYPDPGQVNRLKVGRAADLWLVRRVNERTAYVSDPEFDAKRFDAMASRFPSRKVWVSSLGNFELYHARIQPDL